MKNEPKQTFFCQIDLCEVSCAIVKICDMSLVDYWSSYSEKTHMKHIIL